MPRRILVLLAPFALLAAFFSAPLPVAGVETGLWADLSGDQEVPGPGAPDGYGFAQLWIDPDVGSVCWSMGWDGIDEPTAAHIHAGAEGVAGAPVVTLSEPLYEGCLDGLDPAALQAIVDAPADYYVNIHTTEYPDGAIRGQLYRAPSTLFFELDGADEVPGPGDPDGDGRGAIELIVDSGSICYWMETQRLDPATAAHMHIGADDVSGPIAIPLNAPGEGFSEGCIDGLDSSLLAAIVADPAGYYVNVHTEAYPDGAVRGQLSTEEPAYPQTLFAGISGDAEAPGPGDPEIGGFAELSLDVHDGTVCVYWNLTGIEAATAAHIHEGAEGIAGGVVVALATPFETDVDEPCTFGADPSLLQAMVDDPGAYYVNVHTDAYPDGAGRGQLSYEPPPPPPCAPPEVCDGPIGPGDYVFNGFSRSLSFSLDEEWFATVPGDGFWLDHPSGETGIYVVDFGGIVGEPPCGFAEDVLEQKIDISAAALTDWLVAHPALDSSAVGDVSLGGLDALQVDITGVVPDECSTRPFLILTAGSWFRIADGEYVRVVAQDVASTVVILVDDFDGIDVEASLDRAQPVLDSLAWGPLPVPGDGGETGGGGDEGELPDSAVPESHGAPLGALVLLLGVAALGALAAMNVSVRRERA